MIKGAKAKMKKITFQGFLLNLCLIAFFLAGSSHEARAHENGKLMWSTDGKPRGELYHSWINYISTQGAQGTHWVWRIQKYYPDFTLACSTAHKNGCTANKTEGRFEYTTVQLTTKFELKGAFKALSGGLGFDASKAWTSGTNFTIGQTISIKSGYTAYAMIIALDKYIPAADWGGAWFQTGKTKGGACSAKSCLLKEYEMRWDQGYVFGVWTGHMVTNARAFMCATQTTTEPKVGEGVPSGCALPKIPY